jgi:sucrose phosphorylase
LVEETQRARSINRYQWDRDRIQQLLADESSVQAVVLDELLRRVKIRSLQPAFHPNATQFTLQSRDEIFCFWRQNRDRSQSIFAIHNMTRTPQEMPLSELNLIVGDQWRDLITGQPITDELETILLQPYQSMWISNRDGA